MSTSLPCFMISLAVLAFRRQGTNCWSSCEYSTGARGKVVFFYGHSFQWEKECGRGSNREAKRSIFLTAKSSCDAVARGVVGNTRRMMLHIIATTIVLLLLLLKNHVSTTTSFLLPNMQAFCPDVSYLHIFSTIICTALNYKCLGRQINV